MPEADGSGDREKHQELALIEAVRGQSRPGQEHKLRSKLEAHYDTQRRRIVMGQLCQHEPILGHALHPRNRRCLHVRVGVLPP